jgi:hypothetical protein
MESSALVTFTYYGRTLASMQLVAIPREEEAVWIEAKRYAVDYVAWEFRDKKVFVHVRLR